MSVRGGEGDGGHAATVGERRRAQDQGDGDEHSAPHYWAGRTLPVLAVVSSSIGECQGGVKGVETMMVASFGKVWQAGEASTREQSARRLPERVDTHAWHHGHAWSPRELPP